MNPQTKLEALALIDFMMLPSQQKKHGKENCDFMISTLRMHLNASTPEQNEPALVEDIERIASILQKGS